MPAKTLTGPSKKVVDTFERRDFVDEGICKEDIGGILNGIQTQKRTLLKILARSWFPISNTGNWSQISVSDGAVSLHC
jgi:hypothetical protein